LDTDAAPAPRGFLERLALHRPELRAWASYDWANSVFMTTVLQVFPIYFVSVAAAGLPRAQATQRFAFATSAAVTLVALLAPVLGALADHAGIKKKLLGGFMLLGTFSTAGLFLVQRGDWKLGAALFVLGNVGVTGSLVFYESLLPHVAARGEMDRLCTSGFALGYLGGGLLLAVNLLWITRPAAFGIPDDATAIRLSFLSAAVWWLGFSLPILTRVPEPPSGGGRLGPAALGAACLRLARTFHELRSHRDALLLLCAFLVYNDGINTIIRMATSYGTEVGIARGDLIAAVLMVQLVGVPFSLLFGVLAGRIGARNAIHICLAVYAGIAVVGYSMTTAGHFYLLAFLVGMVQGGSQALSRSLFASMIPPGKSAELFGFFGVFEKFGGVVGPAMFAAAVGATGSSRPAILSLVGFFAVGAALLARVDVARGQAAARRDEAIAPV
jgi:MFS transporter, UMF1 family